MNRKVGGHVAANFARNTVPVDQTSLDLNHKCFLRRRSCPLPITEERLFDPAKVVVGPTSGPPNSSWSPGYDRDSNPGDNRSFVSHPHPHPRKDRRTPKEGNTTDNPNTCNANRRGPRLASDADGDGADDDGGDDGSSGGGAVHSDPTCLGEDACCWDDNWAISWRTCSQDACRWDDNREISSRTWPRADSCGSRPVRNRSVRQTLLPWPVSPRH
jgi:hypothetical protein